MRLVTAFAVGMVLAASVRAAPAPRTKKAVEAPVAKPSGDGADYAPADPQLPLPLGSTRPEPDSSLTIGRADHEMAARMIALLWKKLRRDNQDVGEEEYAVGGPYFAVGRVTDGEHKIKLLERGRTVVGRVVHDEEDRRVTRLTGALRGYVFEWYLGDGLALRLSVGVDRWLPFVAPALDWYPTEEVCYCYGWDPIAGFGLSWRRTQEDSTKEP
jgi:hypothetical protein